MFYHREFRKLIVINHLKLSTFHYNCITKTTSMTKVRENCFRRLVVRDIKFLLTYQVIKQHQRDRMENVTFHVDIWSFDSLFFDKKFKKRKKLFLTQATLMLLWRTYIETVKFNYSYVIMWSSMSQTSFGQCFIRRNENRFSDDWMNYCS